MAFYYAGRKVRRMYRMYFANRTLNYGGQKLPQDEKSTERTVTIKLRAVFVGAYSKAVKRLSSKSTKSSIIEETSNRERPVSFYNWLL